MNKFLQSIDIKNVDDFDMEFEYLARDTFDRDLWIMAVVKREPWQFDLLEEFIEASNSINYRYKLSFSYLAQPSVSDVIALYEQWYRSTYRINEIPRLRVGKNLNEIVAVCKDEIEKEFVNSRNQDFADLLNFINYNFVITETLDSEQDVVLEQEKETSEPEPQLDIIEEKKKDQQELLSIAEEVASIMKKNEEIAKQERELAKQFKKGQYQPIDSIKDITDNSENLDFDAKIYSVSDKTYANKKSYIIGVVDKDNEVIKLRLSESQSIAKEFKNGIKVGMNVRIRGALVNDPKFGRFIRCHYLNALPDDVIEAEKNDVHRVELHLHTNMSVQDGITSIDDYIAYAAKLGHKALALTDHGVVQAFPEAQKAAKKAGIKMLYGCEFYLVDDSNKFIQNPRNIPLDHARYCVLDLETTGLCSRYDSIIEFAGTIVENGLASTSLDILINPGEEVEITPTITNLTHISKEMLINQPRIEEAIDQILNFIGDSILVTHNAKFDISFLQTALKKLGREPLTNPVIDTLAISRYMFSNSTKHSLGALCGRLEVDYDKKDAHRANYDANVLALAWNAMLSQLTTSHPGLTHEGLGQIKLDIETIKHLRPTHVVALIKNAEGVKDMYRLVSMAHVDYYGGTPNVPKSELQKLRKNLLLGSACCNGEVFDITSSYNEQDILDAMSFYDYIEVQPLPNYSHLVNAKGYSYDEIKRYLLDIINCANKLNKVVVATGDVHYLTPKEKIFRDVYIANLGVGKGFHPLARRSDVPYYANPDQHFRTTQEMLDLFAFLGEEKAKEIVVDNTNLIADMIDDIRPVPNDKIYAPQIENCDQILRDICYETVHQLYGEHPNQEIIDRLERELECIKKSEYSNVYYLAYRLVKKSNDDGYIVGSRGSVGSSFVATMASITEVNPLPPYYVCPHCKKFIWGRDVDPTIKSGYDLPEMKCPDCGTVMDSEGQNIPFETFLGFNGEKVPDIDLNFPRDYQSTAHQYTKVLVGEHNVFKAGTIETVKDKTAFGFARKYVESLGENPDTYSHDKLDYLASGCVGVKRTSGQHPGGIVVLPEGHEIYEFTPIQYPADEPNKEWNTTHFDFHSIDNTLLKLDMLGHLDPMALKMMCTLTNINIKDIPLNDKRVISLFSSSKELHIHNDYLHSVTGALGLPEFGTELTRRILEETLPKSFNELAIISGLSHGTGVWGGNAQDLIKSGVATLDSVIGCRDDIMTFLMSKGLASDVAFGIMETVRKKDKYLSDEQKEMMRKAGVNNYYIESADKIEYLFPKGHADAYCIMAVRVAYFKLYYPLEFYATFFSVRSKQYDLATMIAGEKAIINALNGYKDRISSHGKPLSTKEEDIYKTLQIAIEMVQRGYKFKNIDINKSDAVDFIIDKEDKALIAPFITLDGLGENNAITVIKERQIRPFSSKQDLLRRTQLSATNVNDLEALGALNGLPDSEEISLFDF